MRCTWADKARAWAEQTAPVEAVHSRWAGLRPSRPSFRGGRATSRNCHPSAWSAGSAAVQTNAMRALSCIHLLTNTSNHFQRADHRLVGRSLTGRCIVVFLVGRGGFLALVGPFKFEERKKLYNPWLRYSSESKPHHHGDLSDSYSKPFRMRH